MDQLTGITKKETTLHRGQALGIGRRGNWEGIERVLQLQHLHNFEHVIGWRAVLQ